MISLPFLTPHTLRLSMGHPTNSWVGRNGQVQMFAIIVVLAVLRLGSGAGVPVYGPTSVLPTRMASVQALPVEDTDNHLSLLGIREEAQVSPTVVGDGGSPSRSDRQSAQPAEFGETKKADPPCERAQPGLASIGLAGASKSVPDDGFVPEVAALVSYP